MGTHIEILELEKKIKQLDTDKSVLEKKLEEINKQLKNSLYIIVYSFTYPPNFKAMPDSGIYGVYNDRKKAHEVFKEVENKIINYAKNLDPEDEDKLITTYDIHEVRFNDINNIDITYGFDEIDYN